MGGLFGFGAGSIAPTFFAQVPKWAGPLANSGITLAAAAVVMLNAIFNGDQARVPTGTIDR